MLDKVREGDREWVKRDLHQISHAFDRVAARAAARRFVARWRERYPAAVRYLWQDIERRFREGKRRARPMGAYSDHLSGERILFAVFSYENQKAGSSAPFLLAQDS